nr:copia protein [Tanacetum cinerariifolium]
MRLKESASWVLVHRHMGCWEECVELFWKPKKYTEGLGTFEDQGEAKKPKKYTKGQGTFKDQGEGWKTNKYTVGMGTFKDQAEGLADHFRTSATGDDNHDYDQPETSNPTPSVPPPIQQIPYTVSSIKLPILKKREYDIWYMKIEYYLSHTDYPIWKVIHNGNGPVYVIIDTNGMIKALPPKTAKEVVARERKRKARTTLLMALPEDHLAKFHKMANAKEIYSWCWCFIWGCKLEVSKRDVKGTTASSSSNTQNVAFVSTDNTSSTNDVSTAYSVSSPSVSKPQKEGSSSYTDEVIHSFFANQPSAPQLDYDDLEKLQFDTKDPVGFDKTKVECFNFHKMGHFAKDCRAKGNQDSKRRDVGYNGNNARDSGRRSTYQDDSKALITIDREDIDWSGHVEEDTQNYVMMAYSSSNSSSDNEVKSYSKTCKESYARLKKLYDEQKDKLRDASVEITAYTLALKKKLLAEALKEKEDLKTKFENWQNSSKNVSRLLNIQMSVNDKFGLGYGDYRYDSILSYKNEVLQSVFMNKESDLENTSINDRYAEEMHAVPPLMTRNYMPSELDVEIDYSKFTYGPKKTSVDETNVKTSENTSCESDSNVETTTSMPPPIENAPKIVCEPKMWTDAPIIKEYESDGDDNSMSNVQENKETPIFAFTDFVKHVKPFRENVKETGTPNHCPKVEKQDRNGHTRRGLGYGFTRKEWLDFEDVYYVEELKHYNLFMCHKCVTRRTRQHNIYSFNLKNSDPSGDLSCLFAKVSIDESNKWYRRLGHVNFKSLNKLVKGNLVRDLPSKIFENDHTCVACQKGKQHKASCKAKTVSSVNQPLQILHMDLFRPTSAEAVNTACYVLNRVLVTKPQNKTPYKLLTVENQVNKSAGPKEANNSAGTQANDDQGANSEEINLHDEHFVLPIWSAYSTTVKSSGDKIQKTTNFNTYEKPVSQVEQIFQEELEQLKRQEKEANDLARKDTTHENQNANTNSNNLLNDTSRKVCFDPCNIISTAGPSRAFNDGEPLYPDDPSMPHLEDIYASPSEGIFTNSSYDDEGVVTDFNNLETTMNVSPTPTTRIHTIHPKTKFLEILCQLFRQEVKCTRILKLMLLQEEGIDCDEVFAPVARIKDIRIFLDFASYMGFIVYQMDVKIVFLYCTIDEEVYVTQPPSFVDLKFPNKVYKVVKALYGLHQAPRDWYATLSTFVEKSEYRRGAIDKTLFIKQDKIDIMLV